MSGTVKRKRLETVKARRGLKRGRQPHWQALIEGRVHIGYRCKEGAPAGSWLMRRYIGNGKYRLEPLGLADDAADADGIRVLSYKQAVIKANAMASQPTIIRGRLTVRQAWEDYIAAKRDAGQPIGAKPWPCSHPTCAR